VAEAVEREVQYNLRHFDREQGCVVDPITSDGLTCQ